MSKLKFWVWFCHQLKTKNCKKVSAHVQKVPITVLIRSLWHNPFNAYAHDLRYPIFKKYIFSSSCCWFICIGLKKYSTGGGIIPLMPTLMFYVIPSLKIHIFSPRCCSPTTRRRPWWRRPSSGSSSSRGPRGPRRSTVSPIRVPGDLKSQESGSLPTLRRSQ